MRISDWSSDVCSSDLILARRHVRCALGHIDLDLEVVEVFGDRRDVYLEPIIIAHARRSPRPCDSTSFPLCSTYGYRANPFRSRRSEEHTSELQSLMRISYAVFCLKKKIQTHTKQN